MTTEAYPMPPGRAGGPALRGRVATRRGQAPVARDRLLPGPERRRAGGPAAARPSHTVICAGRQTSSMYACSLPSPGRGPILMMRV